MILYGIPNCNTVKKVQTWLKNRGFEYEFHDFKKKGITPEKLNEWCDKFGWENVLNKKGTTWKNLDIALREQVTNKEAAIQVLLNHTSAIKRPILELKNKPAGIGFEEAAYEDLLENSRLK